MPAVSGMELVRIATSNQRSIPCFDVAGGNLDILHGVCATLAEKAAVAFLSTTPTSIKEYFGFHHFVKSINEVSDQYEVHVSATLDHATAVDDVALGLASGCGTVMFDGSRLPFDENVKVTSELAHLAAQYKASIEAELGVIGGKEDDIAATAAPAPTIAEALEFIERTGVDFFAPAVGTAHGHYKSQPEIQWALAETLAESRRAHLVLHGATDLNTTDLKRFVALGFRKINFATGVRSAFRTGIITSINENGMHTKPQVYLRNGRDNVAKFAGDVLDRLR